MKHIRIYYCFLLIGCFFSLTANSQQYVLTSRWFHPNGNKDTLSTLKAIEQFRPARIDWMYCEDSAKLAQLKQMGIPFSLTLNPMQADSGAFTSKKMRITTFNGETYVAPWMKNWTIRTPYWGCVSDPGFKQLFLKRSLQLAALGPYALFVDNPEFNARLKKDRLAGCFCDHCLKKFHARHPVRYLRKKNLYKSLRKDMRDITEKQVKKTALISSYEAFQEDQVRLFLEEWKAEVLKQYPNMKFLCNNYNGEWESYHQVFDGGIAEITAGLVNEKALDSLYARAAKLGKSQLFNSNSTDINVHFNLLRYCKRHKLDALIPWDLFLLNSPKRFYITPAQFESITREN